MGHSLAGGGGSVAEGSEIRYILPFSADIFVENVIYDPAYGFIDGTPLYEILVVGGAVRDVKVVPARSVPFRIYSVQRKGNNSINIRGQS